MANLQQDPNQAPEEAGRGTDTVMAHMSLGEIVIPRAFQDDPDVMEMLQVLFQQNGVDINEFTVGHQANKINPETGYPEFGLGSFFKKVARFVLPKLGVVGGAVNGLIEGGGLKGALKGALSSGLDAAVSLAGSQLLPGLTSSLTGAFGNLAGAPLSGGLQGPTQGSGLLGALSKATGINSGSLPSLGGITGSLTGGGSSFNPVSLAANAFGAYNQDEAIDEQRKLLLGANNKQLANLETFDPSGITSDPGYQFNLEQGQQGLNKGLAAGGSLFSGKALKAASRYNQDYASNAFNDYYQRWLQKVGGQNQLYGNAGDIGANAVGAGAQNISQSLSNAINVPVGQYGGTQDELLKLLRLQQGGAYA